MDDFSGRKLIELGNIILVGWCSGICGMSMYEAEICGTS